MNTEEDPYFGKEIIVKEQIAYTGKDGWKPQPEILAETLINSIRFDEKAPLKGPQTSH